MVFFLDFHLLMSSSASKKIAKNSDLILYCSHANLLLNMYWLILNWQDLTSCSRATVKVLKIYFWSISLRVNSQNLYLPRPPLWKLFSVEEKITGSLFIMISSKMTLHALYKLCHKCHKNFAQTMKKNPRLMLRSTMSKKWSRLWIRT